MVLVSDQAGPLLGAMAEGTVKEVSEIGIEVQFRYELGFDPKWVDNYVTEDLAGRQFAGPHLWIHQASDYRDLVVRHRLPRINATPAPLCFPPVVGLTPLNNRQQEAVCKALSLEDYLLIQGPPGSGKTTLIAAIVRELVAAGKRVVLAAGTNTAVDNIVKALDGAGLADHLAPGIGIPSPIRRFGATSLKLWPRTRTWMLISRSCAVCWLQNR